MERTNTEYDTHIGFSEWHEVQVHILAKRSLHGRIQLLRNEGLAVGTETLVVHVNGHLYGEISLNEIPCKLWK